VLKASEWIVIIVVWGYVIWRIISVWGPSDGNGIE